MARGTLRIYLGAAAGVGKTFAMLNEGRRRAEYGEDVVVGFVETHGRRKTAEQIGGLEVVPRRRDRLPRRRASRRWTSTRVLARRPQVALVDELAHTNVPGSRNEKRWQDVEELLEAGHQRHLDAEHPAPRVAERRRRADHRRQAARDDPRRGRAPRRRAPARRPDAGRAPQPARPRRRLPARADRHGARQLLPARATSPRCASSRSPGSPTASTRALAEYRERHGIERALGDARAGPRRADRLDRRRAARPARSAHRAAHEGRPRRRPRDPAGRARRPVGGAARAPARARGGARRHATTRSSARTSARRSSTPPAR